MNVERITMPRDVARERLSAYRNALHRRADVEYERVASAYESLAKGMPVLRLTDAIAHAPRDEKGRPRIAIARADRRQVRIARERSWEGGRFVFDTIFVSRFGRAPAHGIIRVPNHETPREMPDGYAIVPIVPPEARLRNDLTKHFILWEVEQWSERRLDARPDRDPYLLRRIAEDLYAVVAEWDLTDVERAVMQDRVSA